MNESFGNAEELDGSALDEAVAVKVMGWKVSGRRRDPCRMVSGANGQFVIHLVSWTPHNDIDQAWMVKDHLIELGWYFEYEEGPGYGGTARCSFFWPGGKTPYWSRHTSGATAICLAALQAVGAG